MKVNIVESEILPVYSLWAGPTGTTIDMSEAEVAEFKQAHKQWEEWQNEIDRRLRQASLKHATAPLNTENLSSPDSLTDKELQSVRAEARLIAEQMWMGAEPSPGLYFRYPLKWWQLWRWNPRTQRYHYKYKWVRSCKGVMFK